jgi:tRNA nucleotidyltransferase (CCA-adding enzyme)
MEIISTHGNTDFDAFASMLAAQKLYPKAHILFWGAKERTLASFLDNPFYNFQEISMKEIVIEELERIILVDVSDSSRIGSVADLVDRSSAEVVLYDHHSQKQSDIDADHSVIEKTGACTTILLRELREKEIPISQMEATIYTLGIYEDTGFLTYPTTTPEDVKAVAWLLELGADLSLVSKFLKFELTPEQVELFNDLISNAEIVNIHGIPVVTSSASRENYFYDAAAVVHKLLEIEHYQVFIAAIRMGDRIHLIGRSRNSRVDLGDSFRQLGGGGHAPAAFATLINKTLIEARETVLKILEATTLPLVTCSDIMTRNLISIDSDFSLTAARELMIKQNISLAPVAKGKSYLGVVTRKQLDKAISHRLRVSVTDIMNPELLMLPTTAGIELAEKLIMEGTQSAVFIGDTRENIAGIITRMDLFRRLYIEKYDAEMTDSSGHKPGRSRRFNSKEMLKKRLSSKVMSLLKSVSEVSKQRSEEVFLVGGIVRDLILGFSNQDVDLVVLGDGIEFAKTLATICGGHISAHQRFGTAVMVMPDGFHVDIVSARKESYDKPGALPTVQLGSLRADLYRRDFTINTLAINLTEGKFGQLVDYFGGIKDINNSTVRILHGLSFMDDPTRLLRAARFAARFNFSFSDGTKQALNTAIEKNMFSRISGKRIHQELVQILENSRPLATLELMDKLGILGALHRKVKLDRFTFELLSKLYDTISWFKIDFPDEKPTVFLLYYMVIFEKLTTTERKAVGKRLHLRTQQLKTFSVYKKQVKTIVHAAKQLKLSRISKLTNMMDNLSIESVLFLHAFANDELLKSDTAEYLRHYRSVRPSVSGKDLLAIGIAEGPIYTDILKRLRNQLLDGKLSSRAEQIEYARNFAGQDQDE